MKAKERQRLKTLLPGGWPKFVRVYDNDGATADRYTVVFNGRYRFLSENRPKGRGLPPMGVNVLHLSAAPFHPQGVCGHAEWPGFLDAPSGWTPNIGRKSTALPALGRRIPFAKLPTDCQKAALENYINLWGLPEREAWAAWEAREGREPAEPETLRTRPPEESEVASATPARPGYFDCGGCGHYHRRGFDGDCRDDAERFTGQALDDRHGPEGWEEVPEHDGPFNQAGEPFGVWADRQFEFENCAECGRGAEAHDGELLLGNWFARCQAPAEEALVRAEGPEAKALVESGVLAESRGAETPESPNRLRFEEEVHRLAQAMPMRYGVRYFAAGTYTGEDWPESGEREDAHELGLTWVAGEVVPAGETGYARSFEVVTNREAFVQRALGRQVFASEEEIERAVSTGRATIAVPAIEPPHAQYVKIMARDDGTGALRPNAAFRDLNPGEETARREFYHAEGEGVLARADAERVRHARRAVEEWAGNRLGFPSNGIDLEFHWHERGYCLALMDTGSTQEDFGGSVHKARVSVLLLGPQPEDVILEADDFYPGAMHDPTGRRAAADFVSIFLTWGDGDHELTPRQKLFFAAEAEDLEDWANELEEAAEAGTGETEEF